MAVNNNRGKKRIHIDDPRGGFSGVRFSASASEFELRIRVYEQKSPTNLPKPEAPPQTTPSQAIDKPASGSGMNQHQVQLAITRHCRDTLTLDIIQERAQAGEFFPFRDPG